MGHLPVSITVSTAPSPTHTYTPREHHEKEGGKMHKPQNEEGSFKFLSCVYDMAIA